ncbi:hypothetical protein CI102_513 [Trichoderma harzianum]|nr:hypothetical protein CI102_513 [Trichoderma harzianum]
MEGVGDEIRKQKLNVNKEMMDRYKKEEDQICYTSWRPRFTSPTARPANEDMRCPVQLRNNREARLVAVAASCSVISDSLSPAVDIFFILLISRSLELQPTRVASKQGKKPVELTPVVVIGGEKRAIVGCLKGNNRRLRASATLITRHTACLWVRETGEIAIYKCQMS